ncbi:MAG: hypothetical protein ACLFVO_16635 [Chloroflexaceae bacterium]
MIAGHGPNIGHGFNKYVVIDQDGTELQPIIFPCLTPVPSSLNTFTLGTAQPLRMIRARLSAAFERELTLYETDQAVRTGALSVAGQLRSLPNNWDQPLHENGEAVATRLVEEWGRGTQFDIILIGGGGAEEKRLVQAIKQRFAHAVTVERPQTAIARGYAKLARRLGKGRP